MQIQGLVHASTMGKQGGGGRHGRRGRMRSGGKDFRPGATVNVFVTKVDFDNRRIDFSLCEGRAQ